ncbi:Late competence protein ComEA, DNA receptor [Streptococcus sp. DD10]|uniref:helix-hairpin-helix domain-containing protein n=1 Tax=Streptococcus sp. DD10 TaxID=1777878 RepID=UPI000791B647|nr:helix-hairpin-helix domain-containing protein [Streptococcus sp. DD10]KXT76501.1 Late competence protein ComEA, DNA receptor [Streptococcus sp. DD10]
MLDVNVIVEKLREYKLSIGVLLVGAVLGVGFMLIGKTQSTAIQSSATIAQEVSFHSSDEREENKVENQTEQSLEVLEFITVDVKGAVRKPGLYEVRNGSRVNDAVNMAGGLAENAETKSINLAQKLSDEAVVYVATIGEETTMVTVASEQENQNGNKNSSKVNLNTATEVELQTISGIGQKKATDIVSYREANGGFKTVDDLQNVSGIGTKTLEKLREYVTVD